MQHVALKADTAYMGYRMHMTFSGAHALGDFAHLPHAHALGDLPHAHALPLTCVPLSTSHRITLRSWPPVARNLPLRDQLSDETLPLHMDGDSGSEQPGSSPEGIPSPW